MTRTNSRMNLISNILIVMGVLVFVAGGIYGAKYFLDSKEDTQSYESLSDLVVSIPGIQEHSNDNGQEQSGNSSAELDMKEWYEQIYVDLNKLKEINTDIVGWIYFEKEDISYPILHSNDNEEYSHKLYTGEYAKCGSIWLDAVNEEDFSDSRNILYGHNMANLSMFGKLKKYKNKGYYEDGHQYFQVIYGDKTYRYQIFSYFDIDEDAFEYLNVNFASTGAYEDCIKQLQEKAMRDHGVDVSSDDKIMTLFTCSHSGTKRFIVNAVLVDEHALIDAEGNEYQEEMEEIED